MYFLKEGAPLTTFGWLGGTKTRQKSKRNFEKMSSNLIVDYVSNKILGKFGVKYKVSQWYHHSLTEILQHLVSNHHFLILQVADICGHQNLHIQSLLEHLCHS